MYKFDKKIPLVTIPSAINQNLALLDQDEFIIADTMAVIHNSFINVIPILNTKRRARYLSITTGDKRNQEVITQVRN